LNETLPLVFGLLRGLGGVWNKLNDHDRDPDDDPPLRSELFSAAQMAMHGKHLASSHVLSTRGGRDRLLARLADNDDVITDTCKSLTAAVKAGRQVTPASEWLLDNYYLIEEQIRTARRHLPKHYSKELPRLANPECEGNPRVYQIAIDIIAHGDGRLDPESLSRFVVAYQEVTTLKLGELWAIPIMLRIALIENLRRVAARVAHNRDQRDLANVWADQMIATADTNASDLILLVADMARSNPGMSSSFVAELARRLQGQSPALALALQWITTRLADTGLTIEQQIQAEIAQQAADQVSISNSIGSLRFLGTMDWQEFVETMSAVEQTLRCDPADVYGKMDFATRDQYRHRIEQLAKHCRFTELEVAQQALELAKAHQDFAQGGHDQRTRHIGYYLAGPGLDMLALRLSLALPLLQRVQRMARRAPLASYLGPIGLLTAALTALALLSTGRATGLAGWQLAGIGILAAIGASQLSLSLVNFFATQLTSPHPLPRMDYKFGIPADAPTLVVVPTMLASLDDVCSLCEGLEVRYLANRDPQLRFCLLTDFTDAAQAVLPEDEALLTRARQCIEALNHKYEQDMPRGHGDDAPRLRPFLLLHRPRLWSEGEQAWIGYERKRGKLADLNTFLRGGAREAFSLVVGDTSSLESVRFVITLDTDTELPRDAARRFVATMMHPLNQAQLASNGGRVIGGYGILQPRVAASLPSEDASRYERLCGGEAGIDPYTRTVSDVYQDVFQEGSFVGKGIYDVDVFERVLGNRLPENKVLSHDLLEGCYLRAGLLSDAQLYEAYPSTYRADMRRRHRWIRGDWQLLGWLLPRVPGRGGVREPNPLSALSWWKLFDNLRRSLVAPALTTVLLLAWAGLGNPAFWTGFVVAVLFLPPLSHLLIDTIDKPADASWLRHLRASIDRGALQFGHALLSLVFLPFEALVNLHAAFTSSWRLLVSNRRLLQWQPSNTYPLGNGGLGGELRRMAGAVLLTVAAIAGLATWHPLALAAALPVLLLWLMSPVVAWWISLPQARALRDLSGAQAGFLLVLARKTWSFFETYMGPVDNWLPPDNMQEHPVAVVAHRTSPTNIGMALLANLTAWDFGFISGAQLATRTGNTFKTMARMERHQGHFYNWYDTQTLAPLHPMYVSSVDSGNLAGHLLTLAAGLHALPDQPIVSERTFEAIGATLTVLKELAGQAGPQVAAAIDEALLQARLGCVPPGGAAPSLSLAALGLTRLCRHADTLADAIARVSDLELDNWAERLQSNCYDARDALLELAPWAHVADDPANGGPAADAIPTLRELADFGAGADLDGSAPAPDHRQRLLQLRATGREQALRRIATLAQLASQARAFALMEFGFLYNPTTKLLAIGYNVSERRLDASCYDLLASEIRLCSFVAIAQGQLPQEHWFAMGRQLCLARTGPVLLSWSGSMFEYLMPLLVMPTYANTLLDQTYRACIAAQVEYGRAHDVPWGISESGYNTVDANLNYQYRAFGVPGLGLKRGLADDLVVAPYATMLAVMVDPDLACRNLERMASLGFIGRHGFFEAIDYTPARLPRGQAYAVVRSYMAHHQGMGFLALSYLLHDRPMQRRFESDPQFQATMLVLQERVPKAGAFTAATTDLAAIRTQATDQVMPMRVITQVTTPQPQVQLLSNGRYHVMVTSSGGSYSRWRELAVTRWREDATCDNWGAYCYVADADSGQYWSTTYQPTCADPERYEAIFTEGRAEFRRHDRGLDMHTEMVVSPEDDIELRRTRITNKSSVARTIELTSYGEVVMATAAADSAHPAFGKLFVQTEILPQENAILCSRRPRSKGEHTPWLLHLMTLHDGSLQHASFETSRANFIGRGNSTRAPQAMAQGGPLAGASGSVLDPVVAIRYRIVLEPDQTSTIDIVTGMADTRETALHLIDKYQDRHMADRVFELAWTHGQVVLRQLNASETDAQLYARLASAVIYPGSALRADPATLARNQRGQSGLWAYAVSGDLPIVLLQISDPNNIELARQLVQAHAYWRLKGLVVDLVIWYEDQSGYRQLLHDQIMGLIASGIDAQAIDRPGGIYVRLLDQVAPEDRVLIQSVARAIVSDGRGSLLDQVRRVPAAAPRVAALVPAQGLPVRTTRRLDIPKRQLDNGIGGFSQDGREYLVLTEGLARTPAPWANVLANPSFGTVVSESGQAYTWSENAHEFRLSPWDNDPVTDSCGEAFYLRDEQSGQYWSPTALPVRGEGQYLARHGFGYSVFEHSRDGISSALCTFVPLDAALKYVVLTVRNDSAQPRRLSATGYVEWVLGDLRAKSAMHVITEVDPDSGAILARNAYNTEFSGRVGFFHVDAPTHSLTGDRSEFIGRNGSLARPAAMGRVRLSGKVGAALDPCAALCVPFELLPGQERKLVFMLGVGGRRTADASGLLRAYGNIAAADKALEAVKRHWREVLGAVEVHTPDPAFDVLANGWLMYQTIACRFWARSGYYQSGGAVGFRDQLQDAMAMVHCAPQLLREHLLLCAAHQFEEGDVLHWWHPPQDRGVRTRCSDDYLWLPLALARYLEATGDTGVMAEEAPFLEGRAVKPDEDSYYDMPGRSSQRASLYQHCVRAIEHCLRLGEHGLPLIGTCDWNDGMDRVGHHGKGESVWLAWFLCDVLKRFIPVAESQQDTAFSERCRVQGELLAANVERHAWDGQWYRRAYFDDGTPLGSHTNDECQIDSISQSWAVLSGAGNPERARGAMAELDKRLVRRDASLVQLLDPPFDDGVLDPGYIRGYVPGVRENGGQYTHAAIWSAMAFAHMNDRERAWELAGMINPLHHSGDAAACQRYKVEPYVMAADVYAVPPHVGRGGWTWYTGSSGWMYRLLLESLLGVSRHIDRLALAPLLPDNWPGFELVYRYRNTRYQILVKRGDPQLLLDGTLLEGTIPLIDDGHDHQVVLQLGVAPSSGGHTPPPN
jgi:cyclic beta-1,2-glucan synthetase